MITEILNSSFHVIDYILSIAGFALIIYAFYIFSIVVFSLFRLKDISAMKVIHIASIIEVYAFVCFLIGVILISKMHGLIVFKTLLFGMIVVFNGITVIRLISKTAYFHKLHTADQKS